MILLLLSKKSFSQAPVDSWSNYTGINAAKVNPSLLSSSFCYAEIGTDFSINFNNDFIFIKSKDYINLIRFGRLSTNYFIKGKDYPIGFVLNTKPKNLFETFEVTALSAMFCPTGNLAFGFFLNGRACSSATRVPYELPEIALVTIEDTDEYYKSYSSKNCNVGVMAWNEVGISLAGTLYNRFFSKIDCGITAKVLLGISSASLNINNLDYDLLSRDSVFLKSLGMVSAASLPINYDAPFNDYINVFSNGLKYNGYGLAFDIGFSYIEKMNFDNNNRKTKTCAIPKTLYYYKIGVSLLDFGAIRFKRNSLVNEFVFNGGMMLDFDSFNNISSYQALADTLSLIIYGDAGKSHSAGDFVMGLPSAISVQLDSRISDNFFINASWIQPVRLFSHTVMRSPQIMVAPRYESRYFDFALPVSLIDYNRILIGLSARFAGLTIGTHNIFNFIGLGDSYGLDLYVSLRYYLLKGRCSTLHDACWSSDFR
ncbi:MAG: DUF5723 family protein [Candidatus Limimorpha sp.]